MCCRRLLHTSKSLARGKLATPPRVYCSMTYRDLNLICSATSASLAACDCNGQLSHSRQGAML